MLTMAANLLRKMASALNLQNKMDNKGEIKHKYIKFIIDTTAFDTDTYWKLTPEVLTDILNKCFDASSASLGYAMLNDEMDKLWREMDKEKPDLRITEWLGITKSAFDCFKSYWVKINGMTHTLEEASKIAADKWCELLFGWELKDNGDLDSQHSFNMSVFASALGNSTKEKISDDVKKKCHDLLEETYMRIIRNKVDDRKWIVDKYAQDDDDRIYMNAYGMEQEWIKTDYHAMRNLYLILSAGGLTDDEISCICPWKTNIRIERTDYSVIYCHGGKFDYL